MLITMAEPIPLSEAKTRLSELIRRVQAGEEIVIRRGDTPVARLVAEPVTSIRPPGALRGRVRIADDFDAPLAEFGHLRPPP
ncbi:MAG: type II toxin-antitoxin system Phd/YefM family antitoxin [Solirubrobacteraceae bacterium]